LLLKHEGEENSMEHLAPQGRTLILANKLNKGLKSSLLTLHHICYNSLRTELAPVALSSMICLWELCVLDWGNMHLIMLTNRPYSCTLRDYLIHRELADGERAVITTAALLENKCMSRRVYPWVRLDYSL